MPEYTYSINRPTSTMTIWYGTRKICIMNDITQRKQAKILFQRYLEEREANKYERNN